MRGCNEARKEDANAAVAGYIASLKNLHFRLIITLRLRNRNVDFNNYNRKTFMGCLN